jgi:prolyl oligopeptidase
VPLPADAEFEDVIGDRLIAKLQSPLGAFPRRHARRLFARDIAAGGHAEPRAGDGADREAGDRGRSRLRQRHPLGQGARRRLGQAVRAAARPNGRLDARSARSPLPANSTVHLLAPAARPISPSPRSKGMLTPPTLYAVPRSRQAGASSSACRPSSTPPRSPDRRAALRHVEGRHARALFPRPQERRDRARCRR